MRATDDLVNYSAKFLEDAGEARDGWTDGRVSGSSFPPPYRDWSEWTRWSGRLGARRVWLLTQTRPQPSSFVRPPVRVRPRLCPRPSTGRPPDHPSVGRRQVSSRTRDGRRACAPTR